MTNRYVFIDNFEKYESEIFDKRKYQYMRLIEQCERYFSVSLPAEHPKTSSTYMGIAIINLSLAYILNKDEKYLKEAKRWINTVLAYEKWGNAHLVNLDLSASWILWGLSLGYDWLKDDLSKEEQVRIKNKISHHAKIIYDYAIETAGNGWPTNYYQNHNWINFNGLATAGYVLKDEDALSEQYISLSKENFKKVFSLLPDDGSNYEGVTYWRYGGMFLFIYAHLLKTQEGIDLFKTSNYLQKTFDYRLYQSAGDLRFQQNFGDCHDRRSCHTPCVYYKIASEYDNGYAQKFGNLAAKDFLDEEEKFSKIKPGIYSEACLEFLFYNPNINEKDFSKLDKVKYFEDLGLISIRNCWGKDAKTFSFKCGYPGGKKQWINGWKLMKEGINCLSLSHHHSDNLSYILNKGGDYFTCEDGYNRNIMPTHHSSMLVDGKFTDAENVNDIYLSSAKLRKTNDQELDMPKDYYGEIEYFKVDGDLTYFKGENTKIYPKNLKMEQVYRFALTQDLNFIIFVDKFKSKNAHTYELICNTDDQCKRICENLFNYNVGDETVEYSVVSDSGVTFNAYSQNIKAIMTTQQPDDFCEVNMNTLSTKSVDKTCEQIFVECILFKDSGYKTCFKDNVLTVKGQKEFKIIMRKDFDKNHISIDCDAVVIVDENKIIEIR